MEWIGEEFNHPLPEWIDNITCPEPPALDIAFGAEIEILVGELDPFFAAVYALGA